MIKEFMMLAASAADYAAILASSLPPGPAWLSNRTRNMIAYLAEEAARIHSAFLTVIEESDYRTTSDLLAAFERMAGLPDSCAPPPADDDERRAILHARMTARGGQSAAYFIEVAETLLGVSGEVEVNLFRPFVCGRGAAGDPLCGENWRFAWQLLVYNWPSLGDAFEVGDGAAGDPLVTDWRNRHLECLINKIKPSHTYAFVGYTTDAP